MHIQCPSCILRPLVASDAISLARHANNHAVAQNLRDRFPHPYTVADAEWYIAHVASRAVQTSFGIVVDGEAVGSISLMLGDDISRCSAEVGYWIGQPFWGRGITTEALRGVTRFAFETFDLTRIFAVPFVATLPSARVWRRRATCVKGSCGIARSRTAMFTISGCTRFTAT